MTVHDDLASTASAVASLRRSVAALQGRFGEPVDILRLEDDVARVAADLNPVARSTGHATGPAEPGEIVYIPDGDYDPSSWADAEDEGLGTQSRTQGR